MASEGFTAIVAYLRENLDLSAPGRTPQELRDAMSGGNALLSPPVGVAFETATVGGVPGLWNHPDGGATDAALLYLHGGGYVIGSPDTHRNLTARLALALGCSVFSADYRLGPEHPHPAAVHDSVAAYRALLDAGFAPQRLAIAGDSAGGGLTLATLVALRDGGVALPAAAVAISPWTDLTLSGESMQTMAAADPMVTEPGLQRMAEWFLDGGDPRDPLASPLFAELEGLPPLFVLVGEVETLLDDARRFDERASAAGVDCTLEVYPEMVHVFPAFAGLFPEADAAIDDIAAFLRKQLAL